MNDIYYENKHFCVNLKNRVYNNKYLVFDTHFSIRYISKRDNFRNYVIDYIDYNKLKLYLKFNYCYSLVDDAKLKMISALKLNKCDNIRKINNLNLLYSLCIYFCTNIMDIQNLPNLRVLLIMNCKILSNKFIHNFNLIHTLHINNFNIVDVSYFINLQNMFIFDVINNVYGLHLLKLLNKITNETDDNTKIHINKLNKYKKNIYKCRKIYNKHKCIIANHFYNPEEYMYSK